MPISFPGQGVSLWPPLWLSPKGGEKAPAPCGGRLERGPYPCPLWGKAGKGAWQGTQRRPAIVHHV